MMQKTPISRETELMPQTVMTTCGRATLLSAKWPLRAALTCLVLLAWLAMPTWATGPAITPAGFRGATTIDTAPEPDPSEKPKSDDATGDEKTSNQPAPTNGSRDADPGAPSRPEMIRERIKQRMAERRGDRDGPGHGPRKRLRGLWSRLNDEERQKVLDFVEQRFPLLHEEIQNLQEAQPDRFAEKMGRLADDMRKLMDLLKFDPEKADLLIRARNLDMQIRQTTMRYRRASDDETKETLRTELREYMEEAFDLRIQHREMEVRELEARIEDLHSRVEQAKQNRDALIDRALEQRLEGRSFRDMRHDRMRGRHDRDKDPHERGRRPGRHERGPDRMTFDRDFEKAEKEVDKPAQPESENKNQEKGKPSPAE